jgi:hypothetical protein
MIRIRRDPIQLLLLFLALTLIGLVLLPVQREFFIICLDGVVVCFVVWLSLWMCKHLFPTPVPYRAVLELLDRCCDPWQTEEWVLVKFKPRVSLEEARRNVGSLDYSNEARLFGFMVKFEASAPSRPDVAVFYAPNKGFLLARRQAISKLERKYGRWILDTWYSLCGVIRRNGMTVCDLDHPQVFRFGQHVGSPDDWRL